LGALGRAWEGLGGFRALGRAGELAGGRASWGTVPPLAYPHGFWQEQESGGILRIPEKSRVNTGITVPQEFLQKNPVEAAKNRNSCDPLQNHVPVKKWENFLLTPSF
jgi:hypothetical protein